MSEEELETEPEPHPVLEQLPGIQYCINSPPPWPEAVLLGFQHFILAIGSIVFIPTMLIPEMGGGNKEKAAVIQTSMFVSGVNTLLHSFFGTRLPSVIGGSYAFLIPATTIIGAGRYTSIQSPEQRFRQSMREIQGALIVASCFQMVLGFSGLWRNVARLFSPLSMVSLIAFTALGLSHLGFPLIATCTEVGVPQLILIVAISQYLPKLIHTNRPVLDRYALLISVPFVWFYAAVLTWTNAVPKNARCRTDGPGLIGASPWLHIPYPFHWGPPTFRAGKAFAMMVASFVASTESTGSFIAAARYGSATPVPPSVLSRGVGWLGIGTLLNALFGSVTGTMATVENTGLLALTRAGSRRVVQISSLFMIVFSILGKFGAVLASIPPPILAASYCVFFGYVLSAGLGFLQFCNVNSFRTKFVLGFSFMVGLSVPQYGREHFLVPEVGPVHSRAHWLNDMVSVVLMSSATVAAAAAVAADMIVRDEEARKDNGSDWWEKFVVYSKDARTDEFYRLPGKLLNKCFPSL
ncbi:nucleobase-ascorbate transporter 7-like [Andrographis paniculata]|uniref:nucleobase-ascorbate transporter 7-like n=1 Tax=Andrographis paniculata TaxID=175694 RepID=UPI0021E84547|nr:nucleobase-ascorbate transporter 7-like [Andrographis paniculata]